MPALHDVTLYTIKMSGMRKDANFSYICNHYERIQQSDLSSLVHPSLKLCKDRLRLRRQPHVRWYMYPSRGNSDLFRIRLVGCCGCMTRLLLKCVLAVMMYQKIDQIRHDLIVRLPAGVRVLSVCVLFDVLFAFFLRLVQFASHRPRSPPEYWELA